MSASRPMTASSKSSDRMTSDSRLGRPQLNLWDFSKRPATVNPYELTARYRLSRAPPRRLKSGQVVSRRCRREDSNALSEGRESRKNLHSASDSYDFERDFAEDFDFDAADEEIENTGKGVTGSHSQMLYLRMCRKLNVTPNSYVFRNLTGDFLDLKHHLLGPGGIRGLCVALVENSSVTSVDMEDNGLGEEGARCVAEMLSENTFITELSLADNKILSRGTKSIVHIVKEMDVMIKLDLSGNGLQEYDGELIRDLIEETSSLKELRCTHNCLREIGGIAVADALGWNDTLEVLDLSWNHLRRQGAVAIATALGINSGLKELNVSWNGFYLEGSKELGKSLEKNATLQRLDLSSNRINKECLQHLMKGLRINTALRVLKLSDNPITAAGALYIVQELLECPQSGIRDIDLGEQSVEPVFVEVLKQLEDKLPVLVKYGAILGQDIETRDDEQDLMNENPVMVLLEFGKLLNLRLIDLFSMMDKDGSKTLTREEIKLGLLQANIPLSEKALNHIVEKLDADGDGELDYGELIAGYQNHRRKITKTMVMSREQNLDLDDTEVGRVRRKLKKLMDSRRRAVPVPSLLQGRPTSAVEPAMQQSSSEDGASTLDPGLPSLRLRKKSLLAGLPV